MFIAPTKVSLVLTSEGAVILAPLQKMVAALAEWGAVNEAIARRNTDMNSRLDFISKWIGNCGGRKAKKILS
jgi:hypothetical protein